MPEHLRRPTSTRVRRNRAVAVGIAALALLGGAVLVWPDGDRGVAAGPGPGTTPPSTPAAAPPATRGPRGSGQAVTLAFGGDVHFERLIRQRLDADPASVLAAMRPTLEAADLAMVNLEAAVTTRGTPAAGKAFTFRAPPTAFAALRAGGVDVATLANNHGLDYGRQGLDDTLAAAEEARFPVVGLGRDAAQAYAPWTTEVKGQRIAVLGATQVLDSSLQQAWTATDDQPGMASAYELDRLLASVRAARAAADTVVVYLHWGSEGKTCPNAAQPPLARALVEAGADVVVGGHAHRLLGAGRLGPAVVAYGLGNFVFYKDSGPGTETGVLTVTITGREVEGYRWVPGRLVGQLPRPLTGAAAAQAQAAWEALRPCTGLQP